MNTATLPARHPLLDALFRAIGRCSSHAASPLSGRQRLVRHATLRLSNERQRLQLVRGCVWITRDGCAADHLLAAGEVFDQQPGAPVLVHALEDAEFLLVACAAAPQNVR